jgi:hypothetical protein
MPGVADGTGNFIAWTAAVSAVSATFAGIVASRASTPLSQNPWFILCLVIACVSFLALFLVAPRSAWTLWLRRRAAKHPVQPPERISAETGIKLELLDAKWKLWRRASWLTDIQVRITNTTPDRVISLTKFELESDPGRSWDERPKLTQEQVDALFNEMMSRLEAHGRAHLHEMDLQPGDSRAGWLATHAYLPYPARKGKPYCEFMVTDNEGETYTLPIPGQGPHTSAPPRGLLQLRNCAVEGRRMRERLLGGDASADADREWRFEAWTIKVADALEPWPDLQSQFRRAVPATAERTDTQMVECTETFEVRLRALEEVAGSR